jgi:hypothetical protein
MTDRAKVSIALVGFALYAVMGVTVLVQGGKPSPPPGNPNHDVPEAFCHHAVDGRPDPAHDCACEPMCMKTEEADGTQGEVRVEDHAKCRSNCHPKFCTCKSNCEP